MKSSFASALVVADSISSSALGGHRLITLQLQYQRFIHAEFMTHRVFSRNAGSSRAKPVSKMLEQVRNNPAMPIHWGANQAGMQAHVEVMDIEGARAFWNAAAIAAASIAEKMNEFGLHKQVANRILEPFQLIDVVVSATDWDNFFALRDHPDAQPEIRDLAQVMKRAIDESTPKHMEPFDWHLPYVLDEERDRPKSELVKISAARCARVSYKTFDGTNPKLEEDLTLFERLAKASPPHLSPLEHVATPTFGRYANFSGWKQLRWHLENGNLP